MFENYSVLMSVYGREQADFFRLSTQSILAQTMPTNDFVLVCDGPLTEPLDKVIAELQETHSDILHIIRLENNQGLAKALNRGLQACKNELIARMDSDDVAVPNRCELQLRKFRENPELAIVGGEIDEFEKNPDNVISHKKMPHTHEEILRYAKTRNPFNHPTVMYRRSVILAAGSYPDHILHEDYALWSQLLLSGHIAALVRRQRHAHGCRGVRTGRLGDHVGDRLCDLLMSLAGDEFHLARVHAAVQDPHLSGIVPRHVLILQHEGKPLIRSFDDRHIISPLRTGA